MMCGYTFCLSSFRMFMRKTLFILFVLSVGLASCGYDDSELWNKVKSNETRIAALEEQCRSMNQDIQSLNTIVRALQDNDYVTNVAEVMKDGTVTASMSIPLRWSPREEILTAAPRSNAGSDTGRTFQATPTGHSSTPIRSMASMPAM